MQQVVYANHPETILRKKPGARSSATNHVLLGTWLKIEKSQGAWHWVKTRNRGKPGWVHQDHVRTDPVLKIFYVDVGQGDGAIVESPRGVMLIDGGPNKNFWRFLSHRYRSLFNEGEKVHIEAVVVTHPDFDHFAGLTHVLEDERLTFGAIYHNGIIRYKTPPPGEKFDLGALRNRTINGVQKEVLTETFSTIEEAKNLIDGGLLISTFKKFWLAAWKAHSEGRLKGAKRITDRDKTLPGYSGSPDKGLRVEVLAPVPTKTTGRIEYAGFPSTEDYPKGNSDSSHTRNGHSIVLKFLYGEHSFLFGGDLNIPAEKHLMGYYGSKNPFRVDVAKACHHGSSDFSIDYLRKVKPQVNVFSSGDNKSFDHPLPDALGAAGQHTRGDYPLLFSTEIARAYGKKGIHYGLINARSNGQILTMAQMKEQHAKADVWDSFTVPWRGKFKVP